MISSQKKRKLALVALSACATLCIAGTAGYVNNNYAHTAYAATAQYAVTENLPNWGSQTVSASKPATLSYSGVTAGQYMLNVKVTSGITDEFFASMTATVAGEETVYLSYNGSTQTFYGVVTINSASGSIELNTDWTKDLTVEPELADLYIGSGNDYAIGDLKLSASTPLKLKLDGLTNGNYRVLVDLGFELLGAGEYIEVGVNDDDYNRLTKNDNYFSAYSGTLTVTDASTYLNITTNRESPVLVSVIMEKQAEIKALPQTATLEMWTAVTYSYVPAATGFYAMSVASNDAAAEVSVTLKTSVDSFDGLYIPDNSYPMYMEQGTTYYVEAVLTNSSNDSSAEVTLNVVNWNAPKIEENNVVYAPVSAYGKPIKELTLKVDAGTYNLALMEVPFSFYMRGETIIAHIGNQEIYLDPMNNYTSEVEITSADTTIYFTSSSDQYIAVGVSLVVPEVRYYINLNEPTSITLPAAASAEEPTQVAYYVEGAGVGYYTVTISGLTASSKIKLFTSTSDVEIIGFNKTEGSFVLKYYAEDFALIFANYGAEETFTATVSMTFETISLGANEITVKAGETKTYFMERLAAGNYAIKVNNDSIAVAVENEAVTDGMFTVTELQDNEGLVMITFTNNGEADLTVTVMVTPEYTMTLNTLTTLKVEGESQYMAYYIANVPAGMYSVTLDLPEGMEVMVTANGDYAIFYANKTGSFEVYSAGYLALRFSCANYGVGTEFKVLVKAVEGDMKLGEAQSVELSSTNISNAYILKGLATGEYKLSVLPEGVTAYVDGNAVEGGMFSIWGDTCVITFVYSGTTSATFTATVTPANMLTLGEKTEITIDAWSFSKTYFMELEEGEYIIELTLSDGTMIQVSMDGDTLLNYGETKGTVFVDSGYIAFTFETNTFEEVTFSVVVKAAE
ncbi:MAG: hypothetical protein J1G07_05300 [Clostridiales bacterium]|nr:hypothetical protein [Clostridiales bacterium]